MKDAWRQFAAEFIGTFALVFIGGGAIITAPGLTGQDAVLNIALAHGLILGLLISATIHISGGHLNPAVTAGLVVTRRIEPIRAVVYWIAQLFGATVAAYALKALYPHNVALATRLGGQTISNDVSLGQAIILEAIATFFLVFVVFGTVVDKRAHKLGGLLVGLTLTAAILAIGPLTGGSLNPARSLGPAIVSGVFEGQAAYWVGPLAGGMAAALLYDRLFLARDSSSTDAVRAID
jgi:aquaporin Z